MKSKWTYYRTFFCRSISFAFLTILVTAIEAPHVSAQNTYTIIHTFTVAKGPEGALTRDGAGNLYGITEGYYSEGCTPICGSSVWRLSNSSGRWTPTLLHSFSGSYNDINGAWAEGGVTLDSAGNLYGATPFGGTACSEAGSGGENVGCGVVFKLTHNSNGSFTYSVIHHFDVSDGFAPTEPPVFDKAGNLYGVTSFGGSSTTCGGNGCGVVYKLTPSSGGVWTETVLHTFEGPDGSSPVGGLTFDAAGNLYGAATLGAGSGCFGIGCGAVFKLTPNSDQTWTESILYAFTGGDGSNPKGGLVFDAQGNLYGAAGGGTGNQGVIFQLTPSSSAPWTENVIYSFPGTTPDNRLPNGGSPNGVTFDANGNLYGTTVFGGAAYNYCSSGCGVVFKLTPESGSWNFAVVHAFLDYGALPDSQILVDPAGHLFGTTFFGNKTDGIVFEITP
jgi:uncharacterized repeat protein (TIGR03803 family)